MNDNSMTLRERLEGMMRLRPPAYRALLDAVTTTLAATALDRMARTGDVFPEFVLPDAEGNLVLASELLTKGPLVVVFFRGDWCPFCKETLTALNHILPDITACGARLVALTFDTGPYVDADWRGLNLRFPVLSDVDGGTALTCGTMFRVPDALRSYYESLNIDIGARHGDTAWFLPIPATFIVGQDGIIRHVFASGDVTARMEPEEILTCLRAIRLP